MIHFVYPNASTEGEEKKEFIGCGRYAVSETVPEGYALPFAKIMNRSKVLDAALILAKESSDKGVKKQVVQKKGEKYVGESLHLAYLFALINRARAVKLDIHTDIWCTGSIEVSDEKPFLKSVESEGFQLKLEKGFLSEENKDMLFIVPEGDIQPVHEELCSKSNAEILSLEDFKKFLSEYKGIFQKKTVLKVQGDELFSLINLVFELGPNPYKGLQYFDENDADRFFGREKLTDELFEKYQNLWNSPLRLMAIDGPSGLGKSSVVRAGLVHRRLCRLWDISGVRLSKCPPEKTPPFVMILRPGETPVKTLAEKLFSETEFVSSLSDIQSGLRQPDGQGEFNGLLNFFNKISDNSSLLVIIVDQFEEIYSQCKNAEERDLFVNNLLYAAKHPAAQIMVIIVLRSEFLDRINRHNSVFYNDVVRNRITIEAMTGNQIRSAVTEPARRSGYIFDAKTVDRLISETEKHEGALPLLEFALDSIWKGMEKGDQPADTLKKLNGVGGALASKAQEIYDGLGSEADRRIARRAFMSLINIGEGTFDTRRRALLSEIVAKDEDPEHVRNVLYQFSKPGEAYFITLSTDAEGRETAEITHEALFEHWGSLKQWLDDKRDVLPLARDLEKAVQDWHVQAQDSDLLWRGSKLDSLKDYHEGNKQDMTELQHDFFDASEKRQKRNKVISFTAVFVIFTLILGWGLYYRQAEKRVTIERDSAVQSEIKAKESQKIAEQERDEADKQRVNAELQATALSSENLFASGKEFDALIEAMRAGKKLKETIYEIKPDIRNRVVVDLQQAVYNVKEYNRINGKADLSASIDFSPDNKMFATTDGKSIKIWTHNGVLLKTITDDRYIYDKISFSPDSRTVISCVGGGYNLVQIWSIDGTLLKTFEGHENYVISAKYSPDGQMIASGSADNTLRLWTLDGNEIKTVRHDGIIKDICFSPDGKTIVTGGGGPGKGTVALWDIEGNLIKTFEGHDSWVGSVSFSPDGKMIASMCPPRDEVKIWKIDGAELKTIKGNSKFIFGRVKFSPNGRMIATTTNQFINLWNLDGSLIETFGKDSFTNINDISFSPDSRTIASVSTGDGIIKFWSIDRVKPETFYTGNEDIQFSPDGKTVAIPFNNEIKLFSHDGILRRIFKVNEKDKVKDIDFSPDGKMIAAVNGSVSYILPQTSQPKITDEKCIANLLNLDGNVLKAVDLRNPYIRYQGHGGIGDVTGLSFKPDDQLIVSSGINGSIILWKYLDSDYGSIVGSAKKEASIFDIKYSRDGKLIAAAHNNEIIIYKDNQEFQILRGHNDAVWRVNFSPDGQMLVSASRDNTVRIWNLDGKELNILKCDESTAQDEIGQKDACFSPDGQRILTAGECGLRLWDLSGKQLIRFGEKEFEVADEYIGTGVDLGIDEETKKIIILNVSKDTPASRANIKKGDRILAIDGKTTSGMTLDDAENLIKGEEGTKVNFILSRQDIDPLYVFLLREKIKTTRTISASNSYSCAKFSPDGERIVVGNRFSNVEIWNDNGHLLKSLKGHGSTILDINFSPDGKMFASASRDKTVKLWSSDGIELKTLTGHNDGVYTVGFSPDGQLLAFGSWDGIVRIWKTDGTLLRPLLGEIKPPSYPAYGSDHVSFINPDNNILLLLSVFGEIQLRNLDGELLKVFGNDTDKLWFDNNGNVIRSKADMEYGTGTRKISISSDDKMLASFFRNTVRLWSLDGNLNKELKGHTNFVWDVCFAPDGKKLASCGMDQTVKLWDIDGSLLKTLLGHSESVTSISFSSGGILASLDFKETKLWDIDGNLLGTFSPSTSRNSITSRLKFSPDGKKLAVFGGDNVIIWDFDLDNLMKIACDWASDYLNSDNSDSEKNRNLCDGIEFAGSVLIMQGENMARAGDVEGAIARFEKAQKQNPKLNFDPKEKAQKLAVAFLVAEGENLAKSNKIQEAVLKFQKAIKWNQDLIFDPEERAGQIADQSLSK